MKPGDRFERGAAGAASPRASGLESAAGRRAWLTLGLLQLVLLAALAPQVYYETFSIFRRYDDEGYMMLTLKHVLDGHRLYDAVWTLYGPVYFGFKWILHGLGGLPVSHDVVRLTSCATRLAIGIAASFAAFGLSRNVSLAAIAQVLITTYLIAIRNEPGHPQELASLLTMVTIAIATNSPSRRPRAIAVALGVMVGLLAMVKANLGVFAGLATWMALLCGVTSTGWVSALQVLSGAIVALLPAMLMWPHLDLVSVMHLAVAVTAALLALSALTFGRSDGRVRLVDLCWYGAACIATLLLIGLGTLLAGSTLRGMLDSLILSPMRMPGLFFRPLHVWGAWVGVIGVLLALAARLAGPRLPESGVVLAKLAFGIFTCAATWWDDASALASVATPFVWLTLLPPVDGHPSVPNFLGRSLLCWSTVLNLLQAYPVAGSQVVFGTLLHSLCAVVCLGDAVRWLGARAVTLASPWVPGVASGVLVLVLLGTVVRADVAGARRYRELFSLGLPGAERIRLEASEVKSYRELARFLRGHARTLFSVPGFSSLYFWTGTEPPTLDVIGHVMDFYPEERQAAIVEALRSAPVPLVVSATGGLAPKSASFTRRLERSFTPVAEIGPYQILARKRLRRPRPGASPGVEPAFNPPARRR